MHYISPLLLLLGRVALVAQWPIVVKLSRGRSVGRSVCLSSALCKNGGSDPDAIWYHSSDGSRDKAVSGVGDQSTERGTFKGTFGARHCIQWGLYGIRMRVPRPSELRFGVVRVVGRGIAVLDGGPRRASARGGFGGLCFPFSQWEMPLDHRR